MANGGTVRSTTFSSSTENKKKFRLKERGERVCRKNLQLSFFWLHISASHFSHCWCVSSVLSFFHFLQFLYLCLCESLPSPDTFTLFICISFLFIFSLCLCPSFLSVLTHSADPAPLSACHSPSSPSQCCVLCHVVIYRVPVCLGRARAKIKRLKSNLIS